MRIALLLVMTAVSLACTQAKEPAPKATQPEKPEYFMLRPEVEKQYGYTHAVRIGHDLKISGAVSMDDKGTLVAAGDLEQQMKNCYADL